jgi:hypothetical protein
MMAFHRRHLDAYRKESGRYLIEIEVADIRELFNTLDPSPFNKKDLDPAAEEYLVSAVREIGSRPSALVLHIPASTASCDADGVIPAVRHYFTYRAWHTGEQLKTLLWRGFISLIIGSLFLVSCLWLRQVVDAFSGAAGMEIMSEGLLILGWVAMWRPVEVFLYDWWPEFGRRLLFLRIARMGMEVKVARDGVEQRLSVRPGRASTEPSSTKPMSARTGALARS